MKWDGNMKEKKEIKIEGFDDRNIKMQMEIILKKSREKRKLNTDFLNLLINRINNGLSSFENELNSIPKEYRKQFIELYKKSKKNL
jgi:hypothetical protein